jgi:hypothetical protein
MVRSNPLSTDDCRGEYSDLTISSDRFLKKQDDISKLRQLIQLVIIVFRFRSGERYKEIDTFPPFSHVPF